MTSSTHSRSKPDSFAEFYEVWYPRALEVATRGGSTDPEATAQDLMIVFLTNDYIERYDPTSEGAVSFDSWINAIMYWRMTSTYRSQKRPKGQLVSFVGDVPEVESYRDTDTFEFKSVAKSVFKMLTKRYGIDLAKIWVSIIKQVAEESYALTGRVRQYELARHLRWTEAKVRDELALLRCVLREDADVIEALNGYRSRVAA